MYIRTYFHLHSLKPSSRHIIVFFKDLVTIFLKFHGNPVDCQSHESLQ